MTTFRRQGNFPSDPKLQALWASRLQDELAGSFRRANLLIDVRDFGARLDSVTDDSNAWAEAIPFANSKNAIVFHPGGTSLIASAIAYPAAKVTRIVGLGPTKSTIKGSGATNIITASHSHQSTEWDCWLRGLTIDGGACAGAALSLSRMTKFVMDNVRITNSAGSGLSLLSSWDGMFQDIFFSNSGGTCGSAASTMVLDTVSSEDCVQNRFYALRLEGGASNQTWLDLIGTGAHVVYNQFVDTKLDGNPTTSAPTSPLLRLAAGSNDNVFSGGDVAYGSGVPQVSISGNRNTFSSLRHVVGGASAPTFAYSVLAGNDNHILDPSSNSNAYTGGIFNIAGGCARTRIRCGTQFAGFSPILVDAGFQTDFEPSRAVVAVSDAATIATDAGLGDAFSVTIAASRTIGAPTNATLGHRITHIITQDTTGGWTVAWNAAFSNHWSDVGNTANKRSTISHIWNGTLWIQDGAQEQYSGPSFAGLTGNITYAQLPTGSGTWSLGSGGGVAALGGDLTTNNADVNWRINSGDNAAGNDKLAAVTFARGGTDLWQQGILGGLATDGAFRLFDKVNSKTALIVQPGTVPTVTIGVSSTAISKVVVYSPTLSPVTVSATAIAEQVFTVTGITTADKIFVNAQAVSNNAAAINWRVTAADTIVGAFINVAGILDIPASTVYRIVAIRS